MDTFGLLNLIFILNFGQLTGLINDEEFSEDFYQNDLFSSLNLNHRSENYKYALKPLSCGSDNFLLVLVKSDIQHFEERNLIRNTWGSVRSIDGQNIQVVFLIGEKEIQHRKVAQPRYEDSLVILKSRSLFGREKVEYGRQERRQREDFRRLLKFESLQYGDLLFANNTRSNVPEPQNLFGYNWIDEFCPNSNRYVVSTLDNVFIETYHLYHFLSAVYGSSTTPLLGCHVLNISPKHGEYCDSSAYVLSSKLIPKLINASKSTEENSKSTNEFKWIAKSARQSGVNPVYLNIRYSHDEVSVIRWLRSPIQSPLPFIFVQLKQFPFRDWSQISHEMWRKSRNLQI